jgi:hypothetical protein
MKGKCRRSGQVAKFLCTTIPSFQGNVGRPMRCKFPVRRILSFSALFLFALPVLTAAQSKSDAAPDTGWPTYSNDPSGTRYSPAKQINRNNVAQLQVAWTLPYRRATS